jgi:hypothetical protein
LILKEILLSCVATKDNRQQAAKGGPMIGIAVAFLVSAVVLMTLSAIEG